MQTADQSEYYSHMPLPADPEVPEAVPSPDNPPWNSIEAFGVWMVSVLLILFVPLIFVVPYLALQLTPITDSRDIATIMASDPTAIFLGIVGVIPAHILTLLLAWVVVTRGRRYSASTTVGLEKGGFAWWHYCIILGGFFAVAAVIGHFFPEQENDLLRILRSSRSAVYIVAFVATVTAPIAEEIVYRGMLYSAFQRALGVPAAFLFVTFLFAVVHVPQYYPSYSTIFLLVLLSVILTLIRVKTNNLLPCIILHTLFNGFQSVILILEPYITTPQVQEQTASVLRFFE